MNRPQIIEAVEALRQRKCRPEREAIAHYILRKYGTQFQEVFSDLENIVDQGDLIKVEYKGTVSYRSPQSFDIQQTPLLTKHSKILNSNRTVHLILSVVSELLADNESFAKEGIPRDIITSRLIQFDPARFTTTSVPIFIDREIAVGTLVAGNKRLFPKDLALPEVLKSQVKKMRGRKPKSATAAVESVPTTENPTEVFAVKSTPTPVTSTPPKPVRAYGRKSAAEKVVEESSETKNGDKVSTPEETSTGRSVRNKRKKEVFDPSDLPKKKASTTPVKPEKEKPASAKKAAVTPPSTTHKIPKKPGRKKKVVEESSPEKGSTSTLCEHCQKHKNIKGQVETFLICSDCSVTYHPSCLEYDKKQASLLIEKGTWQCTECKACQVCQEQTAKGPETILCNSCDMGFHFKCLKLAKKPLEAWHCPGCSGEEKTEKEIKPEVAEKSEEEPELEPEANEEEKSKVVVGDVKLESEVKAEGVDTGSEAETVRVQAPKKKGGRPPKKRIITLTLDKEETETSKLVEMETQPLEPATPTQTQPSDDIKVENPNVEVDDDDIPTDASKWTPSQVEAYFKKHGLREEGALFKNQEIDGLSLLLMKRQDIVNGMKLLLGPALKVFKLVVKLQQSGGKAEETKTIL